MSSGPDTSGAEPARAAAGAEVLLLGDQGRGGCVEASRLGGAREEVDVHPPDASAAELDVARAAPVIGAGALAVTELGDQLPRDDPGGALGEHPGLRHAGRCDV